MGLEGNEYRFGRSDASTMQTMRTKDKEKGRNGNGPTGQTIVQADLGLGEFLGRCMSRICLIVSSDFKIGSC